MTLSEQQQTFATNVGRLILKAEEFGIKLTLGEAFRTREQQEIYVKQGKSKTLNSRHLQRLAIDFNFFINGKLVYDKAKIAGLGAYWESLHTSNKWGGNFVGFTDVPHFEMVPQR